MTGIISLIIDNVIKVITTSPVKDFLISLTASSSWDGIKVLARNFKENSTERIVLKVFSDTMSQFYEQLCYEYDEDSVIESLLNELIHVQKGQYLTSWTLRKCIERVICGETNTLSDNEFSLWVAIFANNCALYPEIFLMYQIEKNIKNAIFTNRDLLIQRINSKIRISIGNEDHSAHLFSSTIDKARKIFQQSWKEEVLSLFAKLPSSEEHAQQLKSLWDLVSLNTDYELVLDSLNQIYSLHDSTKITKELHTQIKEKIRHPHFNKVWLVIGKTGSGKTYFVNEFLQATVESLDKLEDQIIPCIINISKIESGKSFESFLAEEFSGFIGAELYSLENTNQVIKEMGANVCFVFDGISNHFSSQEEWTELIMGIKACSKYDQLRWIITVDEYDYYYLENDRSFLDQYCLAWTDITRHKPEKGSLFCNAFSLDQYNAENNTVSSLLKDTYGIDEAVLQTLSLAGISTPKEATIFGEVVSKKDMIGFPTTYFEYLQNITVWKNNELIAACGDSIDQVLSAVIKYVTENQTDELDNKKCDNDSLISLRKVQLVRPEFRRETDVFSLSQGKTTITYRLNIYPFWAIKLTRTISQDVANAAVLLTRFPKEIQHSLVPSFVFYNYEKYEGKATELIHLFEILNKNKVLIYALFTAHRATPDFSSILYQYLCHNMTSYVTDSQSCYSVLYFVFYSRLGMSKKLELLNMIEHYIPEYGFIGIYERTFCEVIRSAQSETKFKKNLKAVTKGQEASLNYINGNHAAIKYLSLPSVRKKQIDQIIWDFITYCKSNHFTSLLYTRIGNNESFGDYFIRRCISNYLSNNIYDLSKIYQHFEKFFELEAPFGDFVRRNLTCAAGNIFSNMHNQKYNALYIALVKEMAACETEMNRLTTFFLIANSINTDNSTLHPALKEILLELSTDEELLNRYGERIRKLLNS